MNLTHVLLQCSFEGHAWSDEWQISSHWQCTWEKKKTFNVTFKDLTDTVINIQFTPLYVPVFVLYMYKKTTEKNVVTTEQNNAHWN